MIDLLGTVESSSIDMPDFIQLHQKLKQNGLLPEDVANTLAYKQQLGKRGVDLDSLGLVAELAKKYGDPPEIIEAVSKYGSLVELEQQIAAKEQELDRLNQQLADVHEQLEKVENKSSELKGALEAYEEVAKLGFTEA